MALSLDGSVAVYGTSGTSVTTGTLTCSNAKNVICVVATLNSAAVSSISGGGVSYSERTQAGGGNKIYFWTGYASGTFNSAITVTFTQNAVFATIHAFGINGAPSSSYFDTNASLPNTGTTDPRTVSTDAANTMILGLFRMTNQANPTAGSGYTEIFGGSGSGYTLSEYKIVSTAQSSLSVTIGTGSGDSNGAIGDAIKQLVAIPSKVYEYNQSVQRATYF